MKRSTLEKFLQNTLNYEDFDDYCKNGLQIEGSENIKHIAFAVSFNLPILKKAIELNADAIIVHHGFFGKDYINLRGAKKERIKLLLEKDISLFGIHLPLDAHKKYGNNAQLFSFLDAKIEKPYEVGFIGENTKKYNINKIMDIFHEKLGVNNSFQKREENSPSIFTPKFKHKFTYLDNGPKIPKKIAIVSGGAASWFEKAVDEGIDTYITGEIDERIPAISLETETNYIALGHYYSEKVGVLALQKLIKNKYKVKTTFIDIENIL
ncbi:MAG: Nif3-like dinuclear metal center hexameric protein [Candidatus Marinimicrobia bacterium]|nr:Nif3-like dinuclear metal center hexameric protein [Candidatus Neomarinimicrobiota bacterium]